MEPCPQCGNQFDPWVSKDKGQKYPFRSCYPCRQKRKVEQEQNLGPPGTVQFPQPPSTPPPSAGERIAKVLEDNIPDMARNIESILDDLKDRRKGD